MSDRQTSDTVAWVRQSPALLAVTAVLVVLGFSLYGEPVSAFAWYLVGCAVAQGAAMALDHGRAMRRIESGR